MNTVSKIGVVLVNWNGGDLTLACVNSLKRGDVVPWKIVILDNASTDGSAEKLAENHPDVHLIRSDVNRGFTGGNNVAIRYLLDQGSDFVWVLNNDTVVDEACLRMLLEAMIQDPGLAACSGKILYTNPPDQIWYAGSTWNEWALTSPHRGRGELDKGQYDESEDVHFISGCCMLVRQSVFSAVGLFDEVFFAYCEDVDWCIRARRMGLRLRYIPRAVLWHEVSSSLRKMHKNIGGGTTSPYGLYLLFRNRIFIIRKHAHGAFRRSIAGAILLMDVTYYVLGLVILRRWAKIRALLRGVRDGVGYSAAAMHTSQQSGHI